MAKETENTETVKFKYTVPPTVDLRTELRESIGWFVREKSLHPPLSMSSLSELALEFVRGKQLNNELKGWVMVEINNHIWLETVASIPYEKRILLLPVCLRNSGRCKADIDDLGLLCNLCHHCTIPEIQTRAEDLGMMSLVAEGFTSVIGLVKSGVAEAVVGVSCLDSLEKAFPLLINNAVPGLAIPLNKDGCKDTNVDEAYVYQLMKMKSQKEAHFLDYDQLKSTIKSWFEEDNLSQVLSSSVDQTSLIVRNWMGNDGKRWRPYLLTATYMALTGRNEIPNKLQRAAIAIECFHKASLVHDDIQDNDMIRYGKETINAQYGDPIAINVGDMYLGEGYRLLTQCDHMGLIKLVSEAHINLCKGQGMELEWCNNPRPLNLDEVLEIFCYKTVPAFEVALLMGALCVNDDEQLQKKLSEYAKALGIAYQLKDDVEDFDTNSPLSTRPSAVLAALFELKPEDDFVNALLQAHDLKSFLAEKNNADLFTSAISWVKNMVEEYHKQALSVIQDINNMELKRLLFRVTQSILK
jgi:geranylgeranyl diphosphate synthase, type II